MVTPRRGVMVVALQVVAVPPWRRRLRRLASPGLGGIAICFAAAQPIRHTHTGKKSYNTNTISSVQAVAALSVAAIPWFSPAASSMAMLSVGSLSRSSTTDMTRASSGVCSSLPTGAA